MATQKVAVSDVTFKPVAGQTSDADIKLGIVLEFATQEYRVIALAVRAAVPDEQLSKLDTLSKEMIENMSAVLEADIRKAITKAEKAKAESLGEVLRYLSASNNWSITVSQPCITEIPADQALSSKSVSEIAQKYVVSLFAKVFSRAKKQVPAWASPYGDTGAGPQIPPPWMLEPKYWLRPNSMT
jgi:hypothetical protein